MKDMSLIADEFCCKIEDLFVEFKPKRIIETGTYLGNGSTELIASLIRDIPIENAEFHSIECNDAYQQAAQRYLRDEGLSDLVHFWSGLSIPSKLLPTIGEIDAKLCDIKAHRDHPIGLEGIRYTKEVREFKDDNMLEKVINSLSGKPDFVLLDSAGHLGGIEFLYLLSLLKDECFIALDDINHVKHFETFKYISKSELFEVIATGDEKFGYAITKYTPK